MQKVKALPLSLFVLVLLVATPIINAQQAGNTQSQPSSLKQGVSEDMLKKVQQPETNGRDELLEGARARFIKHIETAIDYLEKLGTFIEGSEYLTGTEKSAAKSDVDSLTTEFEYIGVSIGNVETRDSFKGIVQEVRTLWEKTHELGSKYIGIHISNRYQFYRERMDTVANRIQVYIDEQSAQGLNVTEVQLLLNEYGESVERANSYIQEAQALHESIQVGSGLGRQTATLAQTQLRSAKQEMYHAGDLLHDAVYLIQQGLGE